MLLLCMQLVGDGWLLFPHFYPLFPLARGIVNIYRLKYCLKWITDLKKIHQSIREHNCLFIFVDCYMGGSFRWNKRIHRW